METLMAVFSSVVVPDSLADYSIDYAAEKGAKLIFLDVRTKEIQGKAVKISCDIGFLGNKIREKLEKEICESRDNVINMKLCELESKAKEKGIKVQIIIIDGPYIDSILKVAKQYSVKTIIAENLNKKLVGSNFSVIDIKTIRRS
ncbi:hypothetical protein JXI42_02545 [bacterium]|nr:hypothetical protein [bacterium]